MTFEGIKMPKKKPVTKPATMKASTAASMTAGKAVNGSTTTTTTAASQPPSESSGKSLVPDSRRDRVSLVMKSVFNGASSSKNSVVDDFMLGKSKIFLSETQFQALEARRRDALNRSAFVIQCAWRRYRRERRLESALLIQAIVRGFLQRYKRVDVVGKNLTL